MIESATSEQDAPVGSKDTVALSTRLKTVLAHFWLEKVGPLNLGVFRIALFATLLTSIHLEASRFCSRLPNDLLFVPTGADRLVQYIPINEPLTIFACTICQLACLSAIAGLYSRSSALIAALSGYYALLSPHCVQIVAPHNHNLIWFALLLAVSPCGDALSIDEYIKAWRNPDPHSLNRLPLLSYALPIRFVWILLGVVYFFPGYWKVRIGGIEWIRHGIVRSMHLKWLQLGWMPPVRLDQMPEICAKLAAIATIMFELSFVILVVFPMTRKVLRFAGLLFHNGTYFFMRIPFWHVQTSYVSFFDWNGIFERIGRRLFPQKLSVIFNQECTGCCKMVASSDVADVFRRIDWRSRETGPDQTEDSGTLDLHRIFQNGASLDRRSVISICQRIPFLFCLTPVLLIQSIRECLTGLHRAVMPAPGSANSALQQKNTATRAEATNIRAICVVGVLLITINVYMGAKGQEHGWPFACYPIFACSADTNPGFAASLVFGDGEEIPLDLDQDWTSLSQAKNRHWRFIWPALEGSTEKRQRQCRETARLLLHDHPEWRRAKQIRFYRDLLSTVPEKYSDAPLEHSLIAEFNISAL